MAALVSVASLVGVSSCLAARQLRTPDLPNRGAPADRTDRLLAVAEEFAPFVYHATHPTLGRQDLVANVDFDGNLVGNDNWDALERHRLRPTVYFAALETETHWFVAYHLFHPRDWSRIVLWLNDTHENDGENLQVVVRKRDRRPVLLWAQAHYRSRVFTSAGSGISGGRTKIRGDLLLVDDAGAPSANGKHAAVFVESEGHGIYGAADATDELAIAPDGAFRFACGSGVLFRPARPGDVVDEPASVREGTAPYVLDSLTVKLWPPLRDGRLTGDGRLLDGSWPYRDELVEIPEVPRFYDGDRFSGPFGPDRGISPFALDFRFEKGTLGALFFNPARRYPEELTIEGEWSRAYVEYPFRPAPGGG